MSIQKQQAIIRSVRGKRVQVELIPSARSIVIFASRHTYKTGDSVTVVLETNSVRFLWITTILPLIAVVILFGIFQNGTKNSALSLFMAFLSLSPYFSFIWLLRDQILTTVTVIKNNEVM